MTTGDMEVMRRRMRMRMRMRRSLPVS